MGSPAPTAAVPAGMAALHTHGMPNFGFSVPDVTFWSDPNLLEQALLNRVRNGLEAVNGHTGAHVQMTVTAEDSEMVWRIEGNGPGLNQVAQQRPFERFRTAKAFGTGMGLPVTRKLAGSLGGTPRVGDRPEGAVGRPAAADGAKGS